jgi:hypothetical protein
VLPAEGYSVLIGQYKSGKSLLSLQEALCLSSGQPFLGQKTTQSRVLFVEAEGSKASLQERLRRQKTALNLPRGLPFEAIVAPTLCLTDAVSLAALKSTIRAFRPEVLIMGPLTRLFMLDDENDAVGMEKVNRVMLDLASEYNLSVQLAHHMRKGASTTADARTFFEGSRGSNALIGAMDAGIGLTRRPNGRTGRLVMLLRDGEQEPIPFSFDSEGLIFRYDERGAAQTATGDRLPTAPHGSDDKCREILKLMPLDGSGFTAGQIADRGIAVKNTVKKHLDGMVALGILKAEPKGMALVYALAASNRASTGLLN